MQKDGNLVLYPIGNPIPEYAYWASGTYDIGDKGSLNLDLDGRLYILNATGFTSKNLTSRVYQRRGITFMLKIDWDGLLRLYSHDLSNTSRWSILWNNTNDGCAPRGFCGFNMFCVLIDQKPGCRCLPGFAEVNQGNRTSGCVRNFTVESCKNKGRNYTIREEDNTIWEDATYSVLSQTSREDCSLACLDDCNCEVAIFKDGECKKQRLPLRYGKRSSQSEDSNVVFIKVAKTTESSTDRIFPTIITHIIIIIISCLFVFSLIVVVAIFGMVNHRYCVLLYRRNSHNGNIEFMEDVAPRSNSYAELERMTDGFKEEIGRGSSDQSLPEEQVILEEWVYQCFVDGELGQLVGDEEVEAKQLERIIKVALWCILDEPSLRPSMKKVLLMLEGTVDIPTPPNPTSFISTI
ncbi:hypothetical protein LWI29_016274 [Acer saccharum]|uniref:S-locus glycoprotein domain-containing protein n=1 Tax=Acer saccharum TaxID=4024 RepID=A0AA39TEM5_ACESA|nr:hypothetical protein LWI29_016274 [Acer saccharum]